MALVLTRLVAVVVAWTVALTALAQIAEPARVGVLSLHSSEQERGGEIGISVFLPAMQALGYVEGRNIITHVRHADGDRTKLRSLAAELVDARVQVLVTVGTEATLAARETAPSIPIVMAGVGDPLGTGLVASLARPGGNITGTALFNPETAVKQLEALKEAAPGIDSVAVLRRSPYAPHDRMVARLEGMAATQGIRVIPMVVNASDQLADQFAEARSSGVGAFLVLPQPALADMREEIAKLGLRYALPGAGWQPFHVNAGLLLSYGPNLSDMHARSAIYVDKILKGAKPADLPIEQADRFKFVLNLRTAKALGIQVPAALLARADEVIE